jgi:hypothetical protein
MMQSGQNWNGDNDTGPLDGSMQGPGGRGYPWPLPGTRLIGTVRRECLDRILIFGESLEISE